MLPVIREFMAAHALPDVTVVSDADMISKANMKAIEAEGLSFILGMKVPDVPYVIDAWRREHPGEDIPDGHVFNEPVRHEVAHNERVRRLEGWSMRIGGVSPG
jgi:hypothetical protein